MALKRKKLTISEKAKLVWKWKEIHLWHQLKVWNMLGCFHHRKNVKSSPNEELEISLVHWFQHFKLKNVHISWPVLLMKATEVALRLKIHNFKALDGCWQIMNTIAYLASVCVMNVAVCMKIFWNTGRSPCLVCFSRLQTDNHYRSNGTLLQSVVQQNLQHEGSSMSRGTKIKKVLLCWNSDGSMNLKLFIIRKHAKPKYCIWKTYPCCHARMYIQYSSKTCYNEDIYKLHKRIWCKNSVCCYADDVNVVGRRIHTTVDSG